MAARLFALNGMLVWSEADPTSAELHQIVAGRGDRRQVIVPGIPPVRALVATAGQVIWTDAEGIHILASGEETDFPATSARCLAADGDTVYVSHEGTQSVIAKVGGEPVAKVPGTIDRLLVVGRHLVWTCAGSHDVFAQPTAGGAASIVYGTSEPFALCAADDRHVLIAVGQGLVRVAIATGEIVRLASELTAGTPHAIACHGELAYITRFDVRIGRCIERVANGAADIIHVPVEAVHAIVATDDGVHFIEGTELHHVAANAPAVVRGKPGAAPTSRGIAIELAADGSLKATFTAEVTSCAELVRQIASETPRRLDLVCDKASPGEAFSTACNGKQLASVEALVCDVPWRDTSDGDLGALADVCAAMPALARAFVRGRLELEPLEHATLRELHLVSGTLKPTVARALAASQLPRLERCALRFPKISTASLLGLVKALAQLRAPQLREVHLGTLRGPDQIRDVVDELAHRGRSWTVLAFTGALGGEDALSGVLEAITPPAGIQIALPLDATYPRDVIEALRRRKKWLCDLSELGFLPCDPRAYAAW